MDRMTSIKRLKKRKIDDSGEKKGERNLLEAEGNETAREVVGAIQELLNRRIIS